MSCFGCGLSKPALYDPVLNRWYCSECSERRVPKVKETSGGTDLKPRGLKAPMHLLPRAALVWAARVMGYGASKYKRGNYLLPVEGERPLEKAQEYCGAALRHLTAQTHHSEAFLATAPPADMQEVSGIAWDESKLPHLAHALVSIMMAIQALVDGGLIEEDPSNVQG